MKKGEKLILIVPTAIILITFLVYLIKGHINLYDINFDKLNTFGGFVGGLIGAFLTVVATLYIYKTFYAQKQELEAQKEELRLQKELMSQQQFENTFFNLLTTHRELKNSLVLKKENLLFNDFNFDEPQTDYQKVEVIAKIVKDFEILYNTEVIIFGQPLGNDNTLNPNISKILETDFAEIGIEEKFSDPDNPKPNIGEILDGNWDENNNSIEIHKKKIHYFFKLLFTNYQNQISHYCRNVYHILKFIRENELREANNQEIKQKYKQYANLFQSQLNVSEQKLLFYNFIHFNEDDKESFSTLSLVNHYSFLENIGRENLIFKKHRKFYDFPIKG